ncbi:MAG: hypothetical protein JXL80_00705 [Planctomycetes bacterium]|nr:hypothetical protein [Planctomycetota bacterium]
MTVSAKEREVLRQLASRVAEAAADPAQHRAADLWRRFNSLRAERPMVLAFPEGGWRELVPEASCVCGDPLLRQWELHLRCTVFRAEHIGDDWPITSLFNIRPVTRVGNFGLEETRDRTADIGSFHWDPPVKSEADFNKLHIRSVEVDHEETERRLNLAADLLGDLLRVRPGGMLWWTVGLTQDLVFLRGLDQIMFDMYDRPEFLHRLMALLRDDMMHMIDVYEQAGVLNLNNGPDDYVGSGGVGCTDELPAKDFDGTVRPRDMWCLGESQETVGVGPEQFAEFILPYQLPLMRRFGLVCYGCCEPLDKRFDLLLENLPHLRRVSVSPWCNRELAAEKLRGRAIFSWKPNPAMVCAPEPQWDEVERVTRETLRIAEGCCVEMILKDTHTFCNDPDRVGRWVQTVRRIAEEA